MLGAGCWVLGAGFTAEGAEGSWVVVLFLLHFGTFFLQHGEMGERQCYVTGNRGGRL